MRIKIENFGPVHSFELDLRKLMIFIGRNNSGKSYMSLLLKIINASFQDLSSELFDIGRFREIPFYLYKKDRYLMQYIRDRSPLEASLLDIEKIFKKINKQDSENLIKNIVEKFKTLKAPHRSKVPIPIEIQRPIYNYLKKRIINKMEHIFSKNLTNKFTSKISDLIRFNQKNSSIIIENNIFEFNVSLDRSNKISVNFEFFDINKIFQEMKKPLKDIDDDVKSYFSKDANIKEKIKTSILYSTVKYILREIIGLIDYHINENFFNTIYLPATRSGLLQAYETIAMAYIQLAPETITRKIEFPTLSGISADHINNLYKSQSDNSFITYRKQLEKIEKFSDLIKFVEDDILFGKIDLEVKKGKIRERISYMIDNHKIPLYRASSMVSELASLVIFLKNLIMPDDLLIFEEPESHLHPDSQVKIAKLITKLLKKNVNLVITTHSDFLLQQINNYIKTSNLPIEKTIEIFGEDLNINYEDVTINLFIRDDESNKTTVRKLDFDKFGLTEDIFFEITKELYKESSIIDELINRALENERTN